MVDSPPRFFNSHTNDKVCKDSAVIVLVPSKTALDKQSVSDEVSKYGIVIDTQFWDNDTHLLVVTVKDAQEAERIFEQTEGRITVDGTVCPLHTWTTYCKLLEVVEGPSPPRVGQRLNPASTDDLRHIYNNYLFSAIQTALLLADDMPPVPLRLAEYVWTGGEETKNMDRPAPTPLRNLSLLSAPLNQILQPLRDFRHPTPILHGPQPSWGFLGLPPPYHSLPDTPFFRRATVMPPPVYRNDGLPTLQRITNRYLASMKLGDERDEMDRQLWAKTASTPRTSPHQASMYLTPRTISLAPGTRPGEPATPTRIHTAAPRHTDGETDEVMFMMPAHRSVESLEEMPMPAECISDGSWNQPANLSLCFESEKKEPVTVHVEIRDRGTGNRGETTLDFDPLAPLFEIVPMRPVYNQRTKKLLFVVHNTGAPSSSIVTVSLLCLSEGRRPARTVESGLDKAIEWELPEGWNECPVILVKASRRLGSALSRPRSLLLPAVSVKSLEPSWIDVDRPRPFWSEGEKLVVRVPEKDARRLNYMVLCNSISVVAIGRVRDDGTLSISVTSKMLGRCVLFVYSTQNRPMTDMLQFYVNEQCTASTFVSRSDVRPGQNVTFTMNGDPYGLAVLRAIDDRLNTLTVKSDPIRARSWDFSMFGRPDSRGSGQARLANFVDLKEVKSALESSCSAAAPFFLQLHGACPEARMSPSVVSNFCLKTMIERCLNPEQPTMSTSCDPRNPKTCQADVKVSSIKSLSFLRKGPPPPTEESSLAMLSDVPDEHDDSGSAIREHFHEVWLFDAFKLGASGTSSISLPSPDSVGRWSISSAFWSPGARQLCRANNTDVVAKKDVFMDIDLPRHVYINETITVKISVTSLKADRETKYAVCMADLSRKVCADLGSFGQHGRPTYTRVVVSKENPTDTKTFTMRFLVTGPTSVVFHLREETSFPGKHHCEVGEVLDSVKLHIDIAKRAETEEHYKRLILNADKPLARVALNDDVGGNGHSTPHKDIIEVSEYRSLTDPSAMVTHIHTNILDTDTVYSFTIDLSKFLPSQSSSDENRRSKRGVVDYGNSFLSDVIKRLSAELYLFKRAKMNEKTSYQQLELSENKIGTLLADMLRFSDCSNDTSCGFAEYGRPRNAHERSPLMTSLASSLLCEASADERLVCGAVRSLQDQLSTDRGNTDIDLHDMIDIDHTVDKQWFLNSLLLQVSKDCGAYQCIKNDRAWGKLYLSFYDLDENWRFDDRSVAAMAYMGTNATGEIMRIKMIENLNSEILPFWSAGNTMHRIKTKISSFDEVNRFKRMKSGDVLVNSLGLLAFVSSGAEGRSTDWDPLANWIYEQQQEDGTYDTALDTYFASRALFEYRFRKVDIENDGNLQVTVSCPVCEVRTINVTESSSEIYLPTHVRNLTLTTKGHGKVKAGIRVLATKRQRSRRGLTQDDYYPVRISVEQMRLAKGTIKQTVCLKVLSPILKTIEMTHGLYTGYSTKPTNVDLLSNSSSLRIHSSPSVSSFATHFILEGLKHNVVQCYEVGISEPDHNHEPFHLAPVAIVARHPINDVVGLVLISHPDQLRARRSVSTQTIPIRVEGKRKRSRKARAIVDESIDTVCFQGGACSCAETSCGVQCGGCSRDTMADLRETLAEDDTFGVRVRVVLTERVLVESSYYQRIDTQIMDWKGQAHGAGASISESGRLTIWLRECNPRCLPKTGVKKEERYFLLGDANALASDSEGSLHYVLRDTDRLEAATNECGTLLQVLLLPA